MIRMGDSTMKPLPPMKRVIDYPHTKYKSAKFDVYLAATARFFIGTTSGLTNVVLSLGTPCLLVNCVSNYFQLWNNRVLFTLKPLWNRHLNRYMTISELTDEKFRWNVFNIKRLAELGIEPKLNSSEEILAATLEMLDKVAESSILGRTRADDLLKEELMKSSSGINFFGNGRISESFMYKHEKNLVTQ